MRVLTSAAVAALILSTPALAGDRRGGHRPPSPPGHCGGGCRPPVTPNINVNVNANASASASASARSYINARTYSSGMVGGAVGGGMIVSGGDYYGDYGLGGVGGGYVHVDNRPVRLAPPSMPYGYAVYGFGRDYPVAGPWTRRDDRYGSEGRWREAYRYDERSEHYARWEHSEEYRSEVEARWEYEIIGRESRAYDRGYDDGRADCDCRRPEPHFDGPPHGRVSPDPPHHEPAPPPGHRYEPGPGAPYYGDLPPPDAPPLAPPPRHNYRQEPGERG